MKNFKTTLVAAISAILANFSNGQIYMNSYGNVSLGTTSSAPVTSLALFSYGPALFSQSTAPTSAPLIIANTAFSTVTNPDYTWWDDSQTGLFHGSAGSIGVTSGGTRAMSISAGNISMFSNQTGSYSYATEVTVLNTTTKCWAVEYGGNDKFYVTGAGNAWSNGSYLTSDERLKENITTITDALHKVLKLRGVNFSFIADRKQDATNGQLNSNPSKMQMGVIAQEVEKVIPEVVSTNDKGIKGVAYQNLVGLLIEAIKEQNKSIDSLRTQMNICCNANQLPTGINGGSNSGNLSTGSAMLYQNVPNPFTQATTITCYIPEQSNSVSLMIFDMTGALKTTLPVNGKNEQKVIVNGGQLAAGMYYYTLVIDGKEIDTKKMILTK